MASFFDLLIESRNVLSETMIILDQGCKGMSLMYSVDKLGYRQDS